MSSIPGRARGFAYAGVVAGLLLALAMAPRPWLRNSVFELLPAADYDPLTAYAVTRAELEISGRLLFLIGHEDRAVAKAGARSLADKLREHDLVAAVTDRTDPADVGEATRFYFEHRRNLLTPRQIASIRADSGATVQQQALARIFSPLGPAGGATLFSDPFALFADSMQAIQPSRGALTFDDGFLLASEGSIDFVLVSARLISATLDMDAQARLVADIEAYEAAVAGQDDGIRILSTGFVYFANAGAQSARSEISLIGTGSIVGILALILWLFRSPRPLYLALLTIASGCLLALSVTLWTFGSIHLFTLVFGASLIGVSIDYTFHYLAEQTFTDSASTDLSLQQVMPGITLGLITSVIAYVALTIAPFPGLEQLAVFSSAGLIGAYLTLLCCAGWFGIGSLRAGHSVLSGVGARYVGFWLRMRAQGKAMIGAAVALVSVGGLLAAEVNDDVTILQAQPAGLKRAETEVGRLIDTVPGNTFLVLRADSEEALLRLEERARVSLDELVVAQSLGGYVATSQSVPSAETQRRSVAAYVELVEAQLPGHFAALGVDDAQTGRVVRELSRPAAPFSVGDWLDHAASSELRGLWLGQAEGSTASLILLTGTVDLPALRAAMSNFPDVAVVDQAAGLSALLAAYRHRVSWLLVAGYAAILAFLSLRYGIRGAVGLVIPPVLAGLLALAFSGLAGIPLNLFSLLALILVLGIGIDFTIFLAESGDRLETTMVAVTLSAITTILSFGLLALSATNAVRAFGLTVLIGIAGSFLLAPLALSARPVKYSDHDASS